MTETANIITMIIAYFFEFALGIASVFYIYNSIAGWVKQHREKKKKDKESER